DLGKHIAKEQRVITTWEATEYFRKIDLLFNLIYRKIGNFQESYLERPSSGDQGRQQLLLELAVPDLTTDVYMAVDVSDRGQASGMQ
ncbi:hypothetical protein EI555_015706, partial [Monodon monoceros]